MSGLVPYPVMLVGGGLDGEVLTRHPEYPEGLPPEFTFAATRYSAAVRYCRSSFDPRQYIFAGVVEER